MITIKLFWMLFSWLYWLPASGAAWNSKGHKHINGNAHRSYQVLLFFCVYGTTTLGVTADHYEKQHSSTRNVLGVDSVQELQHPSLANHDKSWCHLCI